jgi:hypothetical protein
LLSNRSGGASVARMWRPRPITSPPDVASESMTNPSDVLVTHHQ